MFLFSPRLLFSLLRFSPNEKNTNETFRATSVFSTSENSPFSISIKFRVIVERVAATRGALRTTTVILHVPASIAKIVVGTRKSSVRRSGLTKRRDYRSAVFYGRIQAPYRPNARKTSRIKSSSHRLENERLNGGGKYISARTFR